VTGDDDDDDNETSVFIVGTSEAPLQASISHEEAVIQQGVFKGRNHMRHW